MGLVHGIGLRWGRPVLGLHQQGWVGRSVFLPRVPALAASLHLCEHRNSA